MVAAEEAAAATGEEEEAARAMGNDGGKRLQVAGEDREVARASGYFRSGGCGHSRGRVAIQRTIADARKKQQALLGVLNGF